MKNVVQKWFGALTVMAIGLCAGGAQHAEAAGLLVAEGGFGGRLTIKEHSARVTINNGIAVTEVTEVFVNQEDRQVEALYTFPVPKKASVSNFSMWINGKEMVGEVVEKERAREIYNSYKRVRRDPGLLEQVDYKSFEMRIFPIGPRAEQKVQITYYQELDFDHDWATYVYPLATNADNVIDNRVDGTFSFDLDVKSAVPIAEMTSPSHGVDFEFVRHADTYHEASLEMREGSLARDIVVAYQVTRPKTGIDVVTSKTAGEDGYFYLTLTAGEELSGASTGMDYVFILDISGSMGSAGKLEMSSDSIGAFLENLGAEDRFEVIAFNVQPRTLFNALQPVDDDAVVKAAEFLRSQRAKGGTVLESALSTAYRYAQTDADRTLNVVVLSDGITEQDSGRVLMDLIRSRPANSRVFCVGVGNEVNRPLLAQMADDAGGLAAFLSRGDDFQRQAQAFRRKLMRPVATDLEIRFDGLEVYDVEPAALPNLYHGAPVRMYGRYRGDGPATAHITADVDGFDLDQSVSIAFPDRDDANPEIERMWALQRVLQLGKAFNDASGRSQKQIVDEIVRLGEGYSIVTPFTSFLVLENDAEYKRWNIERKNALRMARDRRSQEALRRKLDELRRESVAQLGPDGAPQQVAKATPDPRPDARSRPVPSPAGPAPDSARPSTNRTSSGDVNIPVGGGAVDPVSGGLGAALIALVAWRRRKHSAC